jgi:hypothetical protein
MNARFEAPAHQAETIDLRHGDAGDASKENRNYPNEGGPLPLWQEARARTINFRHHDLVRTHWKKVWRSLIEP